MTPYEQVEELYRLYPQPLSFQQDIERIGKDPFGYVIMNRDFVVLGWDGGDCWVIHAIAGNLAKAWAALPYDLTYIAFCRPKRDAKELQIYPLDRLRRLCHASVSARA